MVGFAGSDFGCCGLIGFGLDLVSLCWCSSCFV